MAGLQGKVFAGYQLAAQIGSGGIAQVYRARAQTGGREVVVKIIAPDIARDPGFQQRFQRSVQVGAQLANHPHILPLLASGEDRGSYYLVTPFVQEGTLRDLLRGGFRLGPGDVAPFLQQLATALDYAHQRGIVHGNLKPSNVYLFEGRHVLVGDFGLLWDISRLEMKRKGPGAEAVECFAPEVFSGQTTPAGDIYSLGATLFTTLAGRAPFTGKTPAEVYNAHLHQPVPPLEQIDRKLPAALRALDPILAQAMAKRPEQRFPSAGAMAQAVEATMRQPVGAGAQPGMAGMMPAPLGAPLQSLDFPPLPSSEEASGLMDEGHIAAHLNEAATLGQMGPLGPQGPLGQMGAMGAMGAVAPMPPGGQAPYPPQPMPQPMPGVPSRGIPGGIPGVMPGGVPGAMPGGMQHPYPPTVPPQMPMEPPGAGAQAFVPGLGPIPLGGPPQGPVVSAPVGPQGGQAARNQKGYSATELNLPRLSRMELGPLAPEIEQQLQARLDGAPEASYDGTEVVAAPKVARETGRPAQAQDEEVEWDESRAYTAAHGRYDDDYDGYDDSRESQAMSQEWSVEQSAAYAAPRSEWGYSEELSAQMSVRRPASRRRRDDYDDESVEMERMRASRRGSSRSSRRGRYDDAYEDDERYARRSRRRSGEAYDEYADEPRRGGTLMRGVLIALIPLVLLTLGGVAVLRPDLCPVSTCQKVSDKVHQLVPGLGGGELSPAAAAPLSPSPAQIQLSTPNGTPVSATLKLASASASDVTWQAATSLQWVTLTPANGTVPAGGSTTVTVQAKPVGVSPSTYTAPITVTVGTATVTIPLQITVSGS